MAGLLRSIARGYVRHSPLEKGKYQLIQAMRRIDGRESVVSEVAGRFLMDLDLSEYLQGNLYYYGYYERELTKFIEESIRPGDVMVDVGANIGTFSLLAASLGATCYAFEASPDNCAVLRRNIALNEFSGIHVYECALSDHRGETIFYLYEEPGMRKHVRAKRAVSTGGGARNQGAARDSRSGAKGPAADRLHQERCGGRRLSRASRRARNPGKTSSYGGDRGRR